VENQALTREQLAQKFHWQDNFPEEIQQKLFAHYQQYQHEGDLRLAEMDILSVSDTLYWFTSKKPMQPFLQEHEQYFGLASTSDLSRIAQELKLLQEQANTPKDV